MGILMNHKELGSCGIIGIIPCHGKRPSFMRNRVRNTIFREFSFDMPFTVCHDIIIRRACLYHIILHDTAPGQSVIEAAVHRVHEILHRNRGQPGIQFKYHIPEAFCCNNTFQSLNPLFLSNRHNHLISQAPLRF